MIHSVTWKCDESRPPPEERQRPLVVSLSQRVPCSHDPASARGGRAYRAGAGRRPLAAGARARPRCPFAADAHSRRSRCRRRRALPAGAAGAWPPRPPGSIPRRQTPCCRSATRASCSAPPAPATPGSPSTGSPHGYGPNGAWLAYVASADRQPYSAQDRSAHRARIRQRSTIPCGASCPTPAASTVGAAWLDTLSLAPTGQLWLAPGRIPRRWAPARAKAPRSGCGCRTEPSCRSHRSREPSRCPRQCGPSSATRTRLRTPIVRDRYVGLLRGRAVGPDPGPMLPLPFTVTSSDTTWADRRGDPRRRHRTGPVAAPDGDARQPADRSRAGRRHDAVSCRRTA